jgi:hypothetical protein
MEQSAKYHFSVPGTKITYQVTLTYEKDFLRKFEVSHLIENGRGVHETDLQPHHRDRYLNHLAQKMNTASMVRTK